MNVIGATILTLCLTGLGGIAIGKWMKGIREFYDEREDDG